MELAPACREKIIQLMNKGIRIPNPTSLDIGEDVRIEQISGETRHDLSRLQDIRR